MEITVRHAKPEDYRALHHIFSGPQAMAGTLQMPFPQAESWRERLAEAPGGVYSLVGCGGRSGERRVGEECRSPGSPDQ